MGKKRVLFLCVHNSARSQMAEGLLNALGGEFFEAFSAGSKPTSVHPAAISAMAEIGIDISGQKSKSIEEFLGSEFDYVVTVCRESEKESCPLFTGKTNERIFWDVDDPASISGSQEDVRIAFRRARDQIRKRIEEKFLSGIS